MTRAITGPGKDRGMVFQSYTLFPWLTVRHNVEFGLRIAGIRARAARDRAAIHLAEVGLERLRAAYPKQLSGGMMQRVALARALANDPEILLMDEPFGALDSQTRSLMQELLLEIWQLAQDGAVHYPRHRRIDPSRRPRLCDDGAARRIKEMVAIDMPRPRPVDVLDHGAVHGAQAAHHGARP